MHKLLRTMSGMLADGLSVPEAWAEIARRFQTDPRVRAAFERLQQSEIGRQAWDQACWSKAQWAQHGLPVPWEEPASHQPTHLAP